MSVATIAHLVAARVRTAIEAYAPELGNEERTELMASALLVAGAAYNRFDGNVEAALTEAEGFVVNTVCALADLEGCMAAAAARRG